LACIERDHPDRIKILAFDRVGENRLAVRPLVVNLAPVSA
jgi:hypothetical protein